MKSITRRTLLSVLAGFSCFSPNAVLSAKGKKLAIFYSFSGNSKRVAEVFQKLEHYEILEIKTLEPYNAYDAREDRKKKKLPPISPLKINLGDYRKIILIFPVWGYTPALPMQSFLKTHSINNEVEIISVGVGRLGGIYEDVRKLLPHAKITRFTHIPKAADLTDKELEMMLRNRTLPPSTHVKLTKGLDPFKEEIKARIDFTNPEFARRLPRSVTWCKTPQEKPKPRVSTNPAPDCLSFQNNILYFNGQPVGTGFFYDELPPAGSEVTISGSDEGRLTSHLEFEFSCELRIFSQLTK